MINKFTIQKILGNYWQIELPNCRLNELGWDEMLGEVALILMCPGDRPPPLEYPDPGKNRGAVYSLDVYRVEGSWWTIVRREKFIDRLQGNEALGFIAAYTLTDGERQLFDGLLTYEQRLTRQRRYRPALGIAGLIGCK